MEIFLGIIADIFIYNAMLLTNNSALIHPMLEASGVEKLEIIAEHEVGIPDICHFFSTDTIFGLNFLHTKERKSQQTNFATKQRKSPKKHKFCNRTV